MNYLQIQRFKRLIHWFHLDSVCNILHAFTVEKFELHSAAEFLCERKPSQYVLEMAEIMWHSSSVKLHIKPR